MIFYNIHSAKEFLAEISKCKGRIDMLSNGKSPEVFKYEAGPLADDKWNDYDGVISQLELKFYNPDDLVDMLMYITNSRTYGKFSFKVNELGHAG